MVYQSRSSTMALILTSKVQRSCLKSGFSLSAYSFGKGLLVNSLESESNEI